MYKVTGVKVTDIPKSTVGRPKRDNPILELVKTANETRDKGFNFHLALPDSTDEASKIVAAIKTDLSRAARELGIMVRRKVDHDVNAKTVDVTFWCADKPTPKPTKESK